MSGATSLDTTHELSDQVVEQRFAMIQAAVEAYDPDAPEASHLRAHQVEGIGAFCSTVAGLTIEEFAAGTGIGIISPTGSGKTIMAAEVMRLLQEGTAHYDEANTALRALMLVPRHSIRAQTVGIKEGEGIKQFAPDLTIGRINGRRSADPWDVNVGLYQALPGLMRSGYIKHLNPNAIVCDEMHHVIDGQWANNIQSLAPGRLLVGLTATPEYSETRNVFDIFSKTAIRRTMRDGIEGGYLAGVEGHLYRGSTFIQLHGRGEDFDEEDLFNALIHSEDNYLAAKICAMEVARGRRGVVFAARGYDRAHSKLLANIISAVKIDTPTGTRNIVAEHVDGELSPTEFDEYNRAHHNGEIDILCNVDLLLEGWDNPSAEFALLMRPTKARVMAEQRIGRVLRSMGDKIATIHELVYEFSGGRNNDAQITHRDILGGNEITYGKSVKHTTEPHHRDKKYRHKKFSSKSLQVDPELLRRMTELDDTPIDEIKISCGQVMVPYDWPSLNQLASRFGRPINEILTVFEKQGLPSRVEAGHQYFPPRASELLIKEFGIKPMKEGSLTLSQIQRIARKQVTSRNITIIGVRKALKEAELTPEVCVSEDGLIVHVYDASAARLFVHTPIDHRTPRVSKPPAPKKAPLPQRSSINKGKPSTPAPPKVKKPKKEHNVKNEIPQTVDELGIILEWFDRAHVPAARLSTQQQKIATYARESLKSTLNLRQFSPVPDEFVKLVNQFQGELSPDFRAHLERNGVDLATALFFAQRAKRVTEHAIEKGTITPSTR